MSSELMMLLITAAVLMSFTLLGAFVIMPKLNQRAALKRRMELVSGKAVQVSVGAAGGRGNRRRDIQSRLKEVEESKKEKVSFTVRQRRDLRKAGLKIELRTFFYICLGLGLFAAVIYLVLGYPAFGALPVAVTVGFGLPKYVVNSMSKRRVKKFTKEFANAVDVIVRGIRSGLPIGECLKIISTETQEPVAGVFREIVESQNLGLNLDAALDRAIEQMDTAELKFFAIVLSIQAQTGGNLADTLQNLSNILRDRKKMADKVKALSSEARSSAMIIGSLPFLMTGLLWLVSPEYIGPLFTDNIGQIMVLCGLGWMSVGVFVMKQMVNFEI
jgi:tight adherence protein B